MKHSRLIANIQIRFLTGDARPRFFESRSRCGAREALTVGYQPTTFCRRREFTLTRALRARAARGHQRCCFAAACVSTWLLGETRISSRARTRVLLVLQSKEDLVLAAWSCHMSFYDFTAVLCDCAFCRVSAFLYNEPLHITNEILFLYPYV